MNGVDLNRFEFDYDTTWSAFFLDPDLNIYSRYGGRDGESSDGRLTKESLLHTMQQVLDTHAERVRLQEQALPDVRQELIRQLLHPAPAASATPEDIPLLDANHEGCVHCHQVQEYRYLQSFADGKFDRKLLFGYPLPENLGLQVDRAHGHRLKSVAPDSAAARAQLGPGDTITRVNDVPVHSEQDIRWALHRADDDQPIQITVTRPRPAEGQPATKTPATGTPDLDPKSTGAASTIKVQLQPPARWKQTELGWRKSLRSVPLATGFLAYALGSEERKSGKLPDDRLAIRVLSVRGPGLGTNLGLQKGDVIISLAGQERSRTFEEFQSDLLRLYEPGDTVRCVVLRDGQTRELSGPFPAWHTTSVSVP